MRKTKILLLVVSLLTVSLTGCFGNFALTRRLYTFNRYISDAKFVQTLVFWVMCIIPVYSITGLIDVAILNLIEFWTDSNPLAMNETDVDVRYYATEDTTYEVVTTKNRYDIFDTQNPDNHFAFVFEPSDMSWNLQVNNETTKITEGF